MNDVCKSVYCCHAPLHGNQIGELQPKEVRLITFFGELAEAEMNAEMSPEKDESEQIQREREWERFSRDRTRRSTGNKRANHC